MIYSIDELRTIIAPIAIKYSLPAVYLFGSYARGTATEKNDIDLLIDTTNTEIKSLLSLAAVLYDLEEALGKEIDLITVRSLEEPPKFSTDVSFRKTVNEERVELYAA